MVRTSGVVVVVAALVAALAQPGLAAAASGTRVAQVRATLAKLDTGPDTRIAVTLNTKHVVSGYLDRVGEHSFFVTDPTARVTTQVAYGSVSQLNARMSAGTQLIVTVSVVAAVILVKTLGQLADH